MSPNNRLSIILPCKNEAVSLSRLLTELKALHSEAQIIVVNDGSIDSTAAVCTAANITMISHPYSKGNGAAIKSGTRAASGDILVFMDADGQHAPQDIKRLLDKLDEGYDMVVGARTSSSQASAGRGLANAAYNRFASWMVGHKIADLTSGFRAVKREKFAEFLFMLPNGFSYPTTITMAFFRAGYSVAYVSITAHRREGRSHLRPSRDGIRFFLIIFRVGTLYSPLKLFFPVSIAHVGMGLVYYGYTYATQGRFTNMSVLLFTAAVIIFLIGLISEQITYLLYSRKDN